MEAESRLPRTFQGVAILGVIAENEMGAPETPHGYAIVQRNIRETCGTENRVIEALGAALLNCANYWRNGRAAMLTKETARLAAKWAREIAQDFDRAARGMPSES